MNTAEFEKEATEILNSYLTKTLEFRPNEDIPAMVHDIEALATHRAVELAEKVIGEDEHTRNGSSLSAIHHNSLRDNQRAALAQLQGKGNNE